MLKAMRQAAGKLFAGILIALVMIGFAVVGITGNLSGFTRDTLASVGKTDISATEFQRDLERQMSFISQQFGRGLSLEDARAIGLPQQVLDQLLAEATLDEDGRRLGLGVSEDTLVQRIADDPNFRDGEGNFDRRRLEAVLRQNNLREDDFVKEIRSELTRRQLLQAVTGGFEPPPALTQALVRYQQETRSVSVLTLDGWQIREVPKPDDEQLAEFFERTKTDYAAPEFRKIDALLIDPDRLRQTIEVSDDEIAARFERDRDSYVRPERRRVEQIRLETEEAVTQARDRIASGEQTFEDIVQAQGLTTANVNLGLKSRPEFVDPEVARVAFSANEGDVLAVTGSTLGPSLIRVAEVEAESAPALKDVSASIRDRIVEQRMRDAVSDLYDRVEDDRAEGLTLSEIAAARQMELVQVPEVSLTGEGPDGKRLDIFAGGDELILAAFDSEVGLENDPLSLPNGGFVFFEVTESIPARQRSLEEVRPQVAAAWSREQVRQAIARQSEELLERLKAGATLEQIAGELGLQVKRIENLRRSAGQDLPPAAVAAAFGGPEGHLASAPGKDPTTRLLIRVDATAVPEIETSDPGFSRQEAQLSREMAAEIVTAYLRERQAVYGSRVNMQIYNAVTGAGSTGSDALR